MGANKTPPPIGSYRFVLRRHPSFKLDPRIVNSVSGYNESATTRDITHNDGVRAQTVFVTCPHFAQRLRCKGWQDVTKMWEESQHPTGAAGQTDSLTMARKAADTAARMGGVEVVEGADG